MPAKRKPGPDPVSAYRAKRSLDRTPEPGARPATAGPPPSAGGLFADHMHAARRLHWDLRLEMDGVLRSVSVPKGPSPNRADKRLAVHVEDHPLEYGDFFFFFQAEDGIRDVAVTGVQTCALPI